MIQNTKFLHFSSLITGLGLALTISYPKSAQAVSFSVDQNAVGLPGSDVFKDQLDPQQQNNIYYGGVQPFIGTNVRDVNGGVGGIGLPAGVDLNSLSKGKDPTVNIWDLLFSVDLNSVGQLGTAVHDESTRQEAAGDIFFFNPMLGIGTNVVRPWGQEIQHGLRKGIVGGIQEDELNAFDVYEGERELVSARYIPPTNIYFSINGILDVTRSSEDILLTNGAGGPINLFKDGIVHIGLQNGDDIDALALDLANNQAFFSLAPGSPTLKMMALGSPIARNWSPADILYTNFGGGFNIASIKNISLFAENIGLLATDNVDALDTAINAPDQPLPPIPEKQDLGDAPESYKTLLDPLNPENPLIGGPRYDEGFFQRLGTQWDSEINGQPTVLADGDDRSILGGFPKAVDDEDGVIFGDNWVDVIFNITRPGANQYQLRAWWDNNPLNGQFDHPGNLPPGNTGAELYINDLLTLTPGTFTKRYNLGFDPKKYYSRFRLTWEPLEDVKPWGEVFSKPDCFAGAIDCISHGEVEDYPPHGDHPPHTVVPEPSTVFGTVAMGLLGLIGIRKKRQ
ncbi:MAG TPA: hypothetical protein DEG17_07610 [Cyanobacteria bacterium UBA11149]|nr:hypothetical protein [Cyanobacteria bacterium UBA11367]HBE56884.1 hypothetical protein [Cyanobacteria bacterium UBA11366]HBK63124.1 hypothetical protein [Cyanobacteria bacterium UBA11166]HBR73816.1 hypothetical protein [Cyanobacteria bacterium UBA11159]HBS67581.1 hypothetical protein [Cyanobacteria bacterium UBA11153]HBW88728.1 hypothetical protein [Cyanobacteria bacterium UBA11149]HCA93757.1 hypothetical protein [Cyanobacteria bacterium UBA9226]